MRRRRAADTRSIYDLFNRADIQRNGSGLDPFSSIDDVEAFLNTQMEGCFEAVAVVDETVVGFAGLYPLGGRQKHVGCLSLCVHDHFQHRGIGTALMTSMLMPARVLMGLRRLQLWVFSDNHRAISLYQRFGFIVEGRLASFALRDDGFADALVMATTDPRI